MKFLNRLRLKQEASDPAIQYIKRGPKGYLLVGEQSFGIGAIRPDHIKPTLECSNLELNGSIEYGLENNPESPLVSAEACLENFSFTEFGSDHLKYTQPTSEKQNALLWIHQSPKFSKEIKPPFFSVQPANEISNAPLLFQFFPTASDFENLWKILENGVTGFSISLSFWGVSTIYSAYQKTNGSGIDLHRQDIKCFNPFTYEGEKLYFRQIANLDDVPEGFLTAEPVHFGNNFRFDWKAEVF